MLQKLCPNGVEYVSFNQIGDFIRGITYNKSQEVSSGMANSIKVLRANNITLFSNTLNFDDIKYVSNNVKVRDNQKLVADDILICAGSGSKEHIGKVAYIKENSDFTFGGFMGVVRCNKDMINSRYLFHILTSNIFLNYLKATLNSSTINNLNNQIMNDFEIPVPPIPVQKEIVRILDNFSKLVTSITEGLPSEIEARQKQYEYYRDRLLNFKKSA